jgi:hypothetical protein
VTNLPTMARLVRQLLLLVVAALLSTGPSWSAAQAGCMPEKMTATADSVAGNCGGCHKCPMTGDERTRAFLCGALCGMATQTVVPQVEPAVLFQVRLTFAAIEQSLRGRTSPPDPYPPKPSRAI